MNYVRKYDSWTNLIGGKFVNWGKLLMLWNKLTKSVMENYEVNDNLCIQVDLAYCNFLRDFRSDEKFSHEVRARLDNLSAVVLFLFLFLMS